MLWNSNKFCLVNIWSPITKQLDLKGQPILYVYAAFPHDLCRLLNYKIEQQNKWKWKFADIIFDPNDVRMLKRCSFSHFYKV